MSTRKEAHVRNVTNVWVEASALRNLNSPAQVKLKAGAELSGIGMDASHVSTLTLETVRRWIRVAEEVRRSVPVDELEARVRESVAVSELLRREDEGEAEDDGDEEDDGEAEDDSYLRMELLSTLTEWFKTSFFTWVDSLPCDYCLSRTVNGGVVAPTTEEAEVGLASRTEAHRCTQCGNITRFPRYNDPIKLMETRRGRCGEWHNAFGAMATALGFPTRAIHDFADHVWNECLVGDRWIHVDSCEGIVDRPALYEKGWGKAVRKVGAVDAFGAVDVTRRYCATAPEDVPFGICCDVYTRFMREGLDRAFVVELERVDALERAEMSRRREEDAEGEGELPGRTTGSAAWRQQRGEAGRRGAGETKRVEAPTRYRLVEMEAEAPLAGLRCVCRASGDNAPSESANKAFDGRESTKWLCFQKDGAWLELRAVDGEPFAIASYSLCSANDEPARDPRDWRVESLGDDRQWVSVDARKDIEFDARGQVKAFVVESSTSVASRRVRLVIDSVREPNAANSVQLARFDIVPK